MAGLRILLGHGLHFDTAILSIQLALKIADLRNHFRSEEDIPNVDIAVDEILLVQVDQAANNLLANDYFLIITQTDRPFDPMKQISLFTVLEQ